MRGKNLVAGIAILLCVSSVGCKSASKLTWWKSAEDAQAEAAVMAHSAPTLPSEIAKQAETMSAPSVNITPGVTATADSGTAAPFVPSIAPTQTTPTIASSAPPAYPTTGASSFTSTPAPQSVPVAQTASTSSTLGTTAMPYDPQAVPAATTNAAATVAQNAPTTDSRYGAQSAPAYTPPASSVYQSSGDRYSSTSATPAANTEPVATAEPTTGNAPQVAQATSSYADRYGSYTPPASVQTQAPVTQAVQSSTVPLAQNTAITPTADSQPYRPGGTSDYPSQGAVEVATRPEYGAGSSVPSATPSSETQGAQSYRY